MKSIFDLIPAFRRLVAGSQRDLNRAAVYSLLLGSAIALGPGMAAAEREGHTLLGSWLIWNDPGTMVVRHLTDQVIAQLDTRAAAIAQLHTRADWLERQRHVRATMDRILGDLPQRNSPLNPQVLGVVRKKGYRIEKIVFESLPKMYVTGCLLIPDGLTQRTPTILYTAGSNMRTFRGEKYQQHILNLVRLGYIVFAIDPIGQGERLPFFDPATGNSKVSVFNHTAHQAFLIGTSYAKYYIRDAARALDYLETRPEVDPRRFGMGGLSWGGWQCTIVSAVDKRIAAAASAAGCNVGIRRWFQSMGPTSAGQHYPGFVSAGLDHGDFFEQMAPRAFLRMSTTLDYKVIQGARETYAEYRRAFDALGAAGRLDFTEDDTGHGYTPKNNEAAYRFYGRMLAHPGPVSVETMELMTDEDTKITPTGQVATSFPDGLLAFDFNQQETTPWLQRLDKSRETGESHLGHVRRGAEKLSGIELPKHETTAVFLGRLRPGGHVVERYAVQGESGYVIPLLLYVPDGDGRRSAVILVDPAGKAAAVKSGEVDRLVKSGYIVAVPDVAGTGETKNRRGDLPALQYIAMMINRSVVGLQAGDVMRVRAFLHSKPEQHEIGRIVVVGNGSLGPSIMHAAALDSQLSGVVLVNTPLSYRAVVMNGLYKMNVAEMVSGALTTYDLPDLLACAATRRMALVGPVDHLRMPAGSSLIEQELAFTRMTLAKAGTEKNLRVELTDVPLSSLVDWALK